MYQTMPNAQIRLRSSMNGGFSRWYTLDPCLLCTHQTSGRCSQLQCFICWFFGRSYLYWVGLFSWSSILIGAAFAASIQIEDEHKNTVIRKIWIFAT